MKHLTVRNLPQPLAKALEKERRAGGASLNETVIRLLGRALGLKPETKRSNGLGRFAGRWSARDKKEFDDAVSITEQIDEELWR